jgi:hypothetical protein
VTLSIRQFSRRLVSCTSLVLCVAFLGTTGCGDEDVDSDLEAPTAGGITGGSSGSAGMARTGSSGATAGLGSAAPLTCGKNTCASSFFVPACCASDTACGRGTASECLELNQEGTPDARCADQALIAFGSVAKGCCKSNGKCGLMLAQQGLGCIERTAMPSWATSGNKWTASSCSDTDAGEL